MLCWLKACVSICYLFVCVFSSFFFFLFVSGRDSWDKTLDEHCYRGQTRMQNGWMIDPKR